jgi:O-antigen biosynthesis protein
MTLSLALFSFFPLPYDALSNKTRSRKNTIPPAAPMSHLLLNRIREIGDRLTGGGIRNLSKRIGGKAVSALMSNPLLLVLGRACLKPFPRFTSRLYQLARSSGPEAGSTENVQKFPELNCLYQVAYGRYPEPSEPDDWLIDLNPGVSYRRLAKAVVDSAAFQTLYGPGDRIDARLIYAFFHNAFSRQPELAELSHWLEESSRGKERADLLVALAGSGELQLNYRTLELSSKERYEFWVKTSDRLNEIDKIAIQGHISRLPDRPLISVVIVAKIAVSEERFSQTLHSICCQLYRHWELCMAVPSQHLESSTALLKKFPFGESQLKVASLEEDTALAAKTNSAIALANGDYIAFVDAGDLLPEQALYEVAVAVVDKSFDIAYTDSDQIDSNGKRFDPWFKPGWDPDLLLAEDYIYGLCVYRTQLVREIECLRSEFTGAEFHDLVLRISACTTPDRIVHIPAVLYHSWSDHPLDPSASNRQMNASMAAVRNWLDTQGYAEAHLEPAPRVAHAVRVVWPIPHPSPLVSIVIPTRDRCDLLATCIDGLLHRTAYKNIEILIVDNDSVEPETKAFFERLILSGVRVRVLSYSGTFNHSAMNNLAARHAQGELLLMLNNDIDVIAPGWLDEMVSYAIRPDVGAVGAKLLYGDGKIQHGGVMFSTIIINIHRRAERTCSGHRNQLLLPRTLSAVTGACFLMRRDLFFEVGELDAVNFPTHFNDIDLGFRIGDYGYRIVWTPYAELFHLESASRGPNDTAMKIEELLRDERHLQQTWTTLMRGQDPFHNPNLLFTWDHFEMPSPPRRLKPWKS